MSHQKPKKRIAIKLILLAVLFNFTIANFAFAQTAPPNVKIDAQKLGNAQSNQALCEGTFRQEVLKVTVNHFSTIFVITPTRTGNITKCTIVPADITISATTAGRVAQPPGSAALQTQIEQGEGISSDQVAAAYAEDLKAKTQASYPSKVIGWILKFIFDVLNSVLGVLTSFALMIMAYAIEQAILVTEMPRFVQIGWGIVRDICNMFFIIILIVIALGTILRLKEYSEYGHLLAKLVIAAILVNFSQVIAVTIMNAVNVLVGMFALNGSFKEIFGFVYSYVWQDVGTLPNGWMTGLTQGITMTAFSIVTLVVAIMLAGLFVVRLVGLYVLIIFSPVAYVLNILPATEHYAKEWWEHFLKYLIWAPVAMFVIRIDVALVNNYGLMGGPGDSAFKYIFLTGMMVAAVYVAKKAGMVGADAVIHATEKGLHYGWESADKWFARGANRTGPGGWNKTRRGLSYLSLGALQQGWKKRSEQIEHESYLVAAGKRQDLFNRVLPTPGLGHKTDFGLKAEQQLVADEKKQILTKGNTELIEGMKQALHSKEGEKAFAYAQTLFENYDGNEALSRLGYGTDHEGFQKFIDENFVPIMGEKRANRLAYDLSRTAEEANHWNYARAYKGQIQKDGSVAYVKNDDAEGEVLAEMAKMNPQQADRTVNRLGRGFVEIDVDVPKLDESGNEMKDESGNVIMVKKRFNVGMANWGKRNRKTIDYGAANKTFNLNTASNYMFNDSTGTLNDNKDLWLNLANKFSGMSEQQIQQTRSIIGSVGLEAERDTSGNILRYEKTDADVVSGKKKAGEIRYRESTRDEVKARVFTPAQALEFLKSGKISFDDLAGFKDLRAKIIAEAENYTTDPISPEIIDKLKKIVDKEKK